MEKHGVLIAVVTALAATPLPARAANPSLRFAISAADSKASAKVAFFGLASKTARFPALAGVVAIDPRQTGSIVIDVSLDAAQLAAGDNVTEARLKGPNFFDAAHTPVIRFVGGRLRVRNAMTAQIDGQLTAHGITRPVTLDVAFSRPIALIDGTTAVRIDGTTSIDRRAFGMTSYPFIVGRSVAIRLDIALAPTR